MPPRGSSSRQPDSGDATTRKRRRFFSSANLPPLPLARPSTPPRSAASSDRVLAALKTDEKVVVAAKTFVKEKMGDDKWDVVDKTRVTRGATRAVAVTKGLPPTKARATPTVTRKAPIAKVLPKRLAIGSTAGSLAKSAASTRKVNLRSRTEPAAPLRVEPSPAPPPQPVAGPSNKRMVAPSDVVSEEDEESEEEEEDYEPNPGKRKEFLESGLYCQNENPSKELMLVNRVLDLRERPVKKRGRPSKADLLQRQLPPIATPDGQPVSFPPLPLEFHYNVIFDGEDHEFRLPYNIMWESETGVLDGKKRPPFYQKIRFNQFAERPKYSASDRRAVCHCDPEMGCGDNCMNFIMSYLCGPACPCGDLCGNKSLAKRKGKATKVAWTGSRGFGLFAAEDIKEGEFVIDYRGEIININTFIERISSVYKGKRNFYALAYDRDEVIDAGMRGNDTRFINHGCNPNLEVKKFSTLGDGNDEYEVGMWAIKDIKAGEELFYNYNFDSFAVMVNRDDERQKCMCGAPNCVGFLGRKSGEKSAKMLAADLAAKAARALQAKGKGKGKAKGKAKQTAFASRSAAGTPLSVASAPPQLVARARASSALNRRASTGTPVHILPAPSAAQPLPVNGHRSSPGSGLVESHLPILAPQPVKRPVGRPRKYPRPSDPGPSTELSSSAAAPAAPLAWPSWSCAAPASTSHVRSVASNSSIANGHTAVQMTPNKGAVDVENKATPAAAVVETPNTGSSWHTVTPGPSAAGAGGIMSPETPMKRKRGRPPKVRPSNEIAKRPRGRPRIHPVPEPPGNPPKRPRGRPRKHTLAKDDGLGTCNDLSPVAATDFSRQMEAKPMLPAADASVSMVAAPVVPKRRGRPPKIRPAPYPAPGPAPPVLNGRVHIVGESSVTQAPAPTTVSQPTVTSVSSPSLKLKFTMPSAVAVAPMGESSTGPSAITIKTEVDAQPARPTPKQVEKARRNGAPAGWVYVPVGPAPPAPPTPEKSDRAARLAARRGL